MSGDSGTTGWWRRIPRAVCLTLVAGGALAALYPWAQRQVRTAQVEARVARLADRVDGQQEAGALEGRPALAMRSRLLREQSAPELACWGNVGGCGAGGGGANASGGGVRWVGRSVTGGMLDIQVMGSSTVLSNQSVFSTLNSRFATGNALLEKWIFALNVPIVFKVQDVEVDGDEKLASAAGFGDMSVQVVRKLGITNTNIVSLTVSAPTGSSEIVRQGVLLPQAVQLGGGLPSVTLQYENTMDFDSGIIILGGSLSTPLGGTTETDPDGNFVWGENAIGDYRPPSMSIFTYAGWMLGPFVPSAGFTLTANFGDLRERGEPLDDQPRGVASLNAGCEWSTDLIAVLLSVAGSFGSDRVQSVTFALGVSTSVF